MQKLLLCLGAIESLCSLQAQRYNFKNGKVSADNTATNSFEQAWTYYNLVIQSGVSANSRIASELRGRITLYQYYYDLKRQVNPSNNTL